MSGFEREAAKLRSELAEVKAEVSELREQASADNSERILMDAAMLSTITTLTQRVNAIDKARETVREAAALAREER